jgi:hypothetical protein
MFKRILIGIVLAAAGGVIKQQMGNPSTARSMPDFSSAFSQFVGSSSPVTRPAASSPVQQNVPLGENLTTVIIGNKKFIVPKAAEDDAAPTSAGGHDQRGLVNGRSEKDAFNTGRSATVSLTGSDHQNSRCERLRLIDQCASTAADSKNCAALLRERSDCVARGLIP